MVRIHKINKAFWSKNIFIWAEMSLWRKDIAWLVGLNGSGKTTLFRILSWEDTEFEWAIQYDTKYPLIGYMKQEVSIDQMDISILAFLKKYTGIDKVEQEMTDLASHLDTDESLQQYGDIYEMFDRMWGYDFDHKAEKVLNQIGLGKYDPMSNVDTLSWWEKRKLLLCGTLIKWGDLLLLDEPTNDLDSSSIDGLIHFLKECLASCLIVSHDKVFLNKVVKKIFEINDSKIIQYSWNYDFYEQQKQLAYQQNIDAYEKQEEEKKRIKETTRDLMQKAQNIWNKWNSRDNDKGDWSSKVEKKLARSAKNISNRIEKMKNVDKPDIKKPMQITFAPLEEFTWWIAVEGLKFSYQGNDAFRLEMDSLVISNNDKILLYWENGSGKSTFLKLLTGDLTPRVGAISKDSSLQIWYFAQEQKSFPLDVSAVDFFYSQLGYGLTEVHSVLWAMGFDDVDKKKPIWLLSPWMRLRLTFGLIALKKDNCLILDEPTNHVDIEIREALKKAINEFKWIVIVVSHDNAFIQDIAFTKQVFFAGWKAQEK